MLQRKRPLSVVLCMSLVAACALTRSNVRAEEPSKPAPAAPAPTEPSKPGPTPAAPSEPSKPTPAPSEPSKPAAPSEPSKAKPPTTPAAPAKPAPKPTGPACKLDEPEVPRGGRLDVSGERLGASPVVRIAGKPARILERREDRISVQVAADSNGGPVTVQVDGKSADCGTLVIIGKNH